MPQVAIYGIPKRPSDLPKWGRERAFEWNHDLPGNPNGGIFYIPSLGLMCQADGFGNVNLRDPVTADLELQFLFAVSTDGLIGMCHVPSCDKLVMPLYVNSGGTSVAFMDLKTGKTSVLGSLTAGTYQAAYCPINDLVFLTAWQGPTVHVIDPWTEALHTTSSVSGTIGAIPLGICFCPLNGKIYTVSRTANTVVRINPLTFAVEASTATGGGFDLIFYSDTMKKLVITAASGAGCKTVDPLNSDTVAQGMTGWSGTCFGGIAVPDTSETAVMDSTNSAIRFLDASAALVTSVVPTNGDYKYIGWNPVTRKLWATGASGRTIAIVDPIARTWEQDTNLRSS